MRAKFVEFTHNEVGLTHYDNISDVVHAEYFTAPSCGGYVRNRTGKQVCENLSSIGNTLYWSGEYPLINLIRKEYKKLRHLQSKYLKT